VTDFELAVLRLRIAEALLESEELRQSAVIRSPVAKAHHERLGGHDQPYRFQRARPSGLCRESG
jgi:hypothetical protein